LLRRRHQVDILLQRLIDDLLPPINESKKNMFWKKNNGGGNTSLIMTALVKVCHRRPSLHLDRPIAKTTTSTTTTTTTAAATTRWFKTLSCRQVWKTPPCPRWTNF
jgi:hypothetical protein